jgi:hypothetical protein
MITVECGLVSVSSSRNVPEIFSVWLAENLYFKRNDNHFYRVRSSNKMYVYEGYAIYPHHAYFLFYHTRETLTQSFVGLMSAFVKQQQGFSL